MTLFYCRTPFIITCNADASQIATKVELFIWKLGEIEPTTPTKVIEKESYSQTQYVNEYNISPFVADVIDPFDIATVAMNVKMVKYYKLVTDWILNETLNYVSSYGWSGGFGGSAPAICLQRLNDKRYSSIDIGFGFNIPTADIIVDFDLIPELRVLYSDGTTTEIVDYTGTGIEVFRIPMSTSTFVNGNFVYFQYFTGTTYLTFQSFQLIPECEPKFNPYILSFVNIMGGLQQMTLFKKSSKAFEVKASDYRVNGVAKEFNRNGQETIKLNTGWISEEAVFLIKQISLSEGLSLTDVNGLTTSYVTLKTSSFQEKTHLNDRVINYEMEFEIATQIINNAL